jgi:hypothetical protein
MPPKTSLLDVVEILAMLIATGVAYYWVCGHFVDRPETPIPPGSKTILRLATPPVTDHAEVVSPRRAA